MLTDDEVDMAVAFRHSYRRRFLEGARLAWAAGVLAATAVAAAPGMDGADAPQVHQRASERIAAEKAAGEDARAAAKGDATARDRLVLHAQRGDASAQFYLALLYKEGQGVAKDEARYVALLRQAGEQDHPGAQSRLIGIYEEGTGVPRDPMQAAQWARRAAEQGELAGQLALVKDYYFGRGVARSYVEAIKWQAILEARGLVAKDDEFTRELEAAAGAVQAEEGRALAREWLKGPKPAPGAGR
jgi:hypothetical protein